MSRCPVFPDCGEDSAVPPSLLTIQVLVQSGGPVFGPLQSIVLFSGVVQPAWLTGGVVHPTWLQLNEEGHWLLVGQSAWLDVGGWVQLAACLVLGRLGIETMERILALQTPLQQITVGSGRRLRTQTWMHWLENRNWIEIVWPGPHIHHCYRPTHPLGYGCSAQWSERHRWTEDPPSSSWWGSMRAGPGAGRLHFLLQVD